MNNLVYVKNVTTLRLDESRCNGCRMCLKVCPHAVFALSGKKVVLQDSDRCMECGACSMNCSEDAISVRAGVGCAAAIINGMITGSEPSCDCSGGAASCCG